MTSLIADRLPTTLQLVIMSAVLALVIAIPIGVISAVKMNTALDRILSVITLILVASPVFLTGIVLMIVFALNLELFPSFGTGYDFVSNLYYLFFAGPGLKPEYGGFDLQDHPEQYDRAVKFQLCGNGCG